MTPTSDPIWLFVVRYQGETHNVLARDSFEAHHIAKAVLGVREAHLPDQVWDEFPFRCCTDLPPEAPRGIVGLWLAPKGV
jgi:hypothetical protein